MLSKNKAIDILYTLKNGIVYDEEENDIMVIIDKYTNKQIRIEDGNKEYQTINFLKYVFSLFDDKVFNNNSISFEENLFIDKIAYETFIIIWISPNNDKEPFICTFEDYVGKYTFVNRLLDFDDAFEIMETIKMKITTNDNCIR